MLECVEDEETLNMDWRTTVLLHWGRALYHSGRGVEAKTLLTDWYEQHNGEVPDALFLEWLMRITLFEEGDWEKAGELLAKANTMKQIWAKRPSQERAYNTLCELYYRNLELPGYALRKARNTDRKKPVRRRDGLLSMKAGY